MIQANISINLTLSEAYEYLKKLFDIECYISAYSAGPISEENSKTNSIQNLITFAPDKYIKHKTRIFVEYRNKIFRKKFINDTTVRTILRQSSDFFNVYYKIFKLKGVTDIHKLVLETNNRHLELGTTHFKIALKKAFILYESYHYSEQNNLFIYVFQIIFENFIEIQSSLAS
jgi:hypothetical protein